MTAWQKIVAGITAGILWLAAIVAKHFWPDIDTGAFQLACGAALSALGIHSAATSGSAAPADKQAGFARIGLLAVIAAGALILAGCTTTTASMYRGYATQAEAGIKVWDDNTLTTLQKVLCAQPYSAIQRHPEMQAGVVSLCGPLANTASIDPAQVQLMLNVVKQLNMAPAAAASGAK